MSGKEGRECTNTGTNNQGNDYRSYNDGAYAYENKGESGATESRYYNTGNGHAFYENTTQGYGFHENQNQGTRTYYEKN